MLTRKQVVECAVLALMGFPVGYIYTHFLVTFPSTPSWVSYIVVYPIMVFIKAIVVKAVFNYGK